MTESNSKVIAPAMQSKTEIFIQKAIAVHGNKYDYSLVFYTRNSDNVKIICPVHGIFEQTPKSHLRGCHCLKCSGKARSNTPDYIEKAKKVHGDKYDYSLVEYLSRASRIKIICPTHGLFTQVAKEHLRGYGCFECGNMAISAKLSSSKEKFIESAHAKHGDRYSYVDVIYQSSKKPVLIRCYKHGVFSQRPNDHLNGSGCPDCKNEITLWQRTKYVKHCGSARGGISNLYIIKCFDENEVFYKVGITVKKLHQRFSGAIPYAYEKVRFISEDAGFIWDLEKKLHQILKKHKYQPLKQFGGQNECFSGIPKEVYRLLDDINQTNQIQLIA
ncbi:hypothetical protein KTG70_10815 [Acinetobacter variabilis]|uniref:hypothetical protein n=1 Tax=Acinetobacter variabilis TaxID=70346 RepID=UPI0021CDD829|nr:hypothetical protein [Acinetobacter variabilis]MCU4365628.1 hypothetical protein [Acinetobacter variabilis]